VISIILYSVCCFYISCKIQTDYGKILTVFWVHIIIAAFRQIFRADERISCQNLIPFLLFQCKLTILLSAILRGMECGAQVHHTFVGHISDEYFLYEEIIFNMGVILGVLTYILVLPYWMIIIQILKNDDNNEENDERDENRAVQNQEQQTEPLSQNHIILTTFLMSITMLALYPVAIVCGVFYAKGTKQIIFLVYVVAVSVAIYINSILGIVVIFRINKLLKEMDDNFPLAVQLKHNVRGMAFCIFGWMAVAIILDVFMVSNGREDPIIYFWCNIAMRALEVFIAYMHLVVVIIARELSIRQELFCF